MQTGHDAQHIAVDRHGRRTIGDRPDRASGVRPDARQGTQRRFFIRHLATVLLHDGASAGMKRTGTPVVAEALPAVQDVAFVRRGEGVDVRKPRQEGREPGLYRRHRGLLQHEFTQEDLVGRRSFTGSCPPGQLAPVGIVPVEEALDQPRRGRLRQLVCPCSGHHVRSIVAGRCFHRKAGGALTDVAR